MNKLFLRKTMLLVIALTFAFSLTNTITAQTKNTIDFKTSIIDQDQRPLENGSYNFRFAFYNVATGGSALWSEDWFGVPARMAAISVQLGSSVPFPKNLFKNTSLYLQICLDANLATGDGFGECSGGFEENFKPRKIISSVPWAKNATSLGPVNAGSGETAYNLDTYGEAANLLNLNLNDNQRFTVTSTGSVNFGDGTNSFLLSPENNLFKLTAGSDIFFGDNVSLRNSASNTTSGASLIGVNTSGLQNITGSTLQSVINNIDPLLRWKANGSSVFYSSGNVGIGLNTPAYAIDVVGTGNFTNGIIIGDNPNLVAGAVRFAAGTFEGYDGVSWIPFAGAGASQWLDNGANIYFNTGNVGIGTTTPNRTLEVAGAIRLGTVAAPGAPAAGDIYSSGTALFYYNGTGWVNMTNDATTDNGAGLTYVSNIANSFGIGGSTAGTAEYVFNPTTGAIFKRTTTIQNDPAAPVGANLLLIDATGANAKVNGGSFSPAFFNSAYTPTGAAGTEAYNGIEVGTLLNAGDGTSIDRLRGVRSTVTNNSAGPIEGFFNLSALSTNNGAVTDLIGIVSSMNNFGTADFFYGNQSVAINEAAGNVLQIEAYGAVSTNNGTAEISAASRFLNTNNGTITDNQWGILGEVFNNAAVGDASRALDLRSINSGTGTIGLAHIGIYNETTNNGAVGTDLIGINNVIATSGTQTGTYGLLSSDGATTVQLNSNGVYAINTLGGRSKFSNEIIIGNSVATETGSIRWSGTDFEGYNGSTWLSFTDAAAPPGVAVFEGSDMATDDTSSGTMDVATTPTGVDRLMIATIHYRDPAAVVTGVVFDGGNFTQLCRDLLDDYAIEIWYLVNPNTTATNMTVTWDNPVPDRIIAASNFTNVEQSTPIGDSACNNSGTWQLSHSITVSSSPDHLIFGAATNYSGDNNFDLSPTAVGMIEAYDSGAAPGNVIGAGAEMPAEAGATSTLSWDNTSDGPSAWPWSAAAAAIIGVGGSAPPVTQVWQENGSDIFYSAGNVGINDSTPSFDLDINGTARITNDLGVGVAPSGTYSLEVAGAGSFTNEIIVGNSLADTTGAIRFNGTTFEGYDGFTWNSLGGTGSSQWQDNGSDIYFDTGNVVIGASPTGVFNLEVTGTSSFSSDAQFNGVIGIGIAPDLLYSLSAAGDVRILGSLFVETDMDVTGLSLFLSDLTVDNANLYVNNGSLCVDGGTGCPVLTPGGIYGDLAYAEFDVAENILATQDVEAGDLVSIIDGQVEVVRKSSYANDPMVIGIISTNPGSLGGVHLKPRDGFIVLPLVLSGRVPVKVSTENGEIKAGDPITSSSVPGVAMKATQSRAKIVGYAMESYNSNGVSKIIVFYQPGYLP